MRPSVAVAPGPVVGVRAVAPRDDIQGTGQVFKHPRLVLDRGHGGRRTADKDVREAGHEAALRNGSGYLRRQVDDLALAAGLHGYLLLEHLRTADG